MTWRDRAECLAAVRRGEALTNDWFPEGPSRIGFRHRPEVVRALELCARCPVRSECYTDYVESVSPNLREGIFGGVVFGRNHDRRIPVSA